jgi:D-alanyl-D-alanine carboxypeptidase
MTARKLGIVVAVACSISGTAEATTNLKPFDPVALQSVVEATAKELLLPGAMVLLHTPEGDFAFGYGATEPELGESLDHDPTRVWTPQELLAIAFTRPTIFAPGKEYDYCNTNYALLGLIAEKLEGAPPAKIFQDRLFGPLGMKHTLSPANTSNTIPEPYSHGYLYGSSSYALVDAPYPADLQAAAKAGTLKPNDDTGQNPSYAFAAGGVISTADDLAIWMRALAGGKLFDANHQRQWLDSLEPQDPSKPLGQKYGYGISQITFGPNSVYFHGGEMPGYNSFMGYDPVNDVTLVIWTNLTLSLDGKPTANSIMLRMLDQICSVSPLQ